MLSIRISNKLWMSGKDSKGRVVKFPHKRFNCYACGKEQSFFDFQKALYCPKCHSELPDVYMTLNTCGHSVYWHRNQEVP